jgi:hypothetical protein
LTKGSTLEHLTFHTNIYWTNAEFEKGNLSLQSIKWDEAMGKDPFNPDADFNGIPLANARVAARRLKIFGNGKDAAMKYAPAYGRKYRGELYDKAAPGFKKLFDCLSSSGN